jgi:hypothetical protein
VSIVVVNPVPHSLVHKTHYPMPNFTLDSCSIPNTLICTIVERTITLAVEGGSSSEDGKIANESFTTLRLAFCDFDDPNVLSVIYIGNDSSVVLLVDQYSQRGVIGATDDGSAYSMNFLVLSITCSLFASIVFFVIFLSFRNDESGDEDNSTGDTCSISVASSFDDDMSELGCDLPPPPKS